MEATLLEKITGILLAAGILMAMYYVLRYKLLMNRAVIEARRQAEREEREKMRVYTASLTYYWDGWHCKFLKDSVCCTGVIRNLPAEGYEKDQKVKVRIIGFEEIYILEKA